MGKTHSQPYVQYSWAGYSLTVWANKGRVSPGCTGLHSACACGVSQAGRVGCGEPHPVCLFFLLLLLLFCFVLFCFVFLFFVLILHRSSYCCANAKVAGCSESLQCQGDSQGRGVPRLLPGRSCEVHLWRDPSEWSRECAAGSPRYKSEPRCDLGWGWWTAGWGMS